MYETAEVLQDLNFSSLFADAEDVHAGFNDIEEADEGAGEGLDEVCDTAGAGYREFFPDDANVF